MIEIDGSYLEGGGQIIRTALALSTLTQKPFRAYNIRAGRLNSGLKAQHLNCITALKDLCGADAKGDELGSAELSYTPQRIDGKNITIDIGTAGSISLLLQAVLPPCIFANKPVSLDITGGTDGKWAASYDYFNEVFMPQIKKFCKSIDARLIKRGYHPKGGGKVEIKVNPKFRLTKEKSFEHLIAEIKEEKLDYSLIEQSSLIQINGVSHASSMLQNAKVAERQAESAKLILNNLKVPIGIRTEYCETLSPGSGITLWAVFSKDKDEINLKNPIRLGADALGEKGKPAEAVGKDAADSLVKEIESKAPVDKHLADQLLPFMALAGGRIKASDLTNHSKTNIYAIEKFLGGIFDVDEKEKLIKLKS